MEEELKLSVPMRIAASLAFLRQCNEREEGCFGQPVSLTSKEEAVKTTALDCLMRYFTGENDYGDCPPLGGETQVWIEIQENAQAEARDDLSGP
jgi:hypothetical protein